MFYEIKNANGEFLYRMAYDDVGNPDDNNPVFCVHGLSHHRHSFYFLIKELITSGRRVINVDVVGHGESDWAPDPSRYEITNYAQDCAQIISGLGLKSVDWIGISLGGLIGIRAIVEQGVNAKHLILNDVAPHVPIEAAKFVATWVATVNVHDTVESFINWRAEATQGGPMTDEHKRHRAKYSYKTREDGKYIDVYDKAIAINLFKHLENNEVWMIGIFMKKLPVLRYCSMELNPT